VEALLEPWVEALGPAPEVRAAGRDLLARWAEPHRRYHDLRHLAEVLVALRTLDADVPATVLCAAYWHDAVYDPAAADNEQRSAVLAADGMGGLGAAPPDVAEVVRLVLLTATHRPKPEDDAGGLLCDADLAVLGSAPERYLRYAADVREEYAHLGDEEFRRGRAAVLRGLADRASLFTTASGRRRWERPARENLRAELARLDAAPQP
jgi:predicted metal-dependent HD superfamily phosphohydrolase